MIIQRFTPDVLGQIDVYAPSIDEIRITGLIFSAGAILLLAKNCNRYYFL